MNNRFAVLGMDFFSVPRGDCRFLDPQLFDELKEIIDSGSREVSAMEKPEILEANFFSEILDFPTSSKIREVRCVTEGRFSCHMIHRGKDAGTVLRPSATEPASPHPPKNKTGCITFSSVIQPAFFSKKGRAEPRGYSSLFWLSASIFCCQLTPAC